MRTTTQPINANRRHGTYEQLARSNVLPLNKDQDTAVQQDQTQVQKAGRKRRFKVRNLLLAGFALWAVYVFVFVQSPNIQRLEEEKQSLSAENSTDRPDQPRPREENSTIAGSELYCRGC